MKKIAVKASDLRKEFGTFVAVNDVSFEVEEGAIYGFLGPNGAGKSTTIKILCGILSPTSGAGEVAGLDIFKNSEEIKRTIGYMSQKFSLYEDLTVEENIDFWGGIYGVEPKVLEKRKGWVLEMAGLKSQTKRRCAHLSGGWRQRLALGSALLHSPKIVFLDEPTSGVDPNSRRGFWNLIYELANEGVTVFVTTHYMDEAEYFDRIAFIYKGSLIAEGTPEELKKEVISDRILSFCCKEPQKLMEELKALQGIKEAALFGQGFHLVVDHPERAAAEVEKFLKAKQVAFEGISVILPGLEDVFVSLIETHDAKGNT